jgi:BssS protein family
MNDDLLMFPIVGWEITVVPTEGMICLRLPYLASPFEKLTNAEPGKAHAMHADQAREIRDALTSMIQRIDDHDSKSQLSINCIEVSVDSNSIPTRNADTYASEYQ